MRIEVEPGEWWWGGAVADGTRMPFGAAPHRRELATNAGILDDPTGGANQSAPLLVSSHGRHVWSDEPFTFAFDGEGGLEVDGTAALRQAQGSWAGSATDSSETSGALRQAQGSWAGPAQGSWAGPAQGSWAGPAQGSWAGPAQGSWAGSAQGSSSGLADAFRAAAAEHFPTSGRTPDRRMFSAPQYNTWIEMPYLPTQEGVLEYARGVLDAGFPPGLLMIDDRWSEDYGDWRFDPTRFGDPAAMTAQLHDWGFTVMVWLVPFVSPDSSNSRYLAGQGWLVRDPDGRPAVREWWNGFSTVLDLTHPDAVGWLRERLHELQDAYGVDGFKLDAGDLRDYRSTDVTHAGTGPLVPTQQTEAWARFAAEFAFNELRACWRSGGQPLAQRLHDKQPTWGADGLGSLIPEVVAQGLIGHPYGCPDMVGGGELGGFGGEFGEGHALDQELFVRWAQVSALMPMVQFSLAPWRVLDDEHLAVVREALVLRERLLPEILALVDRAASTGDPIVRPLAFHHPGLERVTDQFLLGEDLLVAPVVEAGARTRHVHVPPGRWQADDGPVVEGPAEVDVEVGLSSLPWWRRVG